jgi:3-carboxy-cis,cis-muconate cycloisomerase
MFTTKEMSSIFSGEARVQRMLDFEAALARAEARAGIIPEQAGRAIADKCRVKLFDLSRLNEQAELAGVISIPLVRMLTELVEGEARGFVHWGATSQDVLDTGMVLQARDGLDSLIGQLLEVGSACALLADRHRRTPMVGRTLLQHALPITFGLKSAHWVATTTRQLRRLHEVRSRSLAVQFGGAAGTLAALGVDGVKVLELLADELDLGIPELPWHTDRDRVAEIATSLGIVAAGMAKIAGDVALLMQTEIGEVSEEAAAGKGGSSSLPQKRNPVDSTSAIASAKLALGAVDVVLSSMVQEHERAVGGWQAEWVALPHTFLFTAGAVGGVRTIVRGLEVDSDRMRANLDMAGGQIMAEALTMALAPHVGRGDAYRVVADLCRRAAREGRELGAVAAGDGRIGAVLSPEDIERALDPLAYLGSTEAFIQKALDDFNEVARV